MKRCRSDELRQPEEEPGAAGEPPGPAAMEAKPGEAAAAAAPEASAVPPPRTKPPDLKVSGGGTGRREPVGWQWGEHPGGVTGGSTVGLPIRQAPYGVTIGVTGVVSTRGVYALVGYHHPHPGPHSATGVTLEDAGWPQDGDAPGMGMAPVWGCSYNGDGPSLGMLLGWGWSQNKNGPSLGMLLGWGCSWDEGPRIRMVPGWDAPRLGMLLD